jgi:hypothetical protein
LCFSTGSVYQSRISPFWFVQRPLTSDNLIINTSLVQLSKPLTIDNRIAKARWLLSTQRSRRRARMSRSLALSWLPAVQMVCCLLPQSSIDFNITYRQIPLRESIRHPLPQRPVASKNRCYHVARLMHQVHDDNCCHAVRREGTVEPRR